MKKTLELAGITVSLVVGAGFATGREIRTYFTKYGNLSYVIIAGVAVLLYLSFLKLMWGEASSRTGKIIAVPYVFFGYILMLAAMGQLVMDYTGFPSFAGVVIGGIMSVLGLAAGFGRFTRFSGWLTPMIITVLVIVLLGNGFKSSTIFINDISPLEVCLSSVKFIGYNFLSGFVVLPEIKSGYTKLQKLLGVGLGIVCITICMIIINSVFLGFGKELETYQMPLINIISSNSGKTVALISVSLLCVIFALSLCGSSVGVARMVGKGKMEFTIGMVFVMLALPLSLIGFGNLMDRIYPLLGFCGFLLLLKTSFWRHDTKT